MPSKLNFFFVFFAFLTPLRAGGADEAARLEWNKAYDRVCGSLMELAVRQLAEHAPSRYLNEKHRRTRNELAALLNDSDEPRSQYREEIAPFVGPALEAGKKPAAFANISDSFFDDLVVEIGREGGSVRVASRPDGSSFFALDEKGFLLIGLNRGVSEKIAAHEKYHFTEWLEVKARLVHQGRSAAEAALKAQDLLASPFSLNLVSECRAEAAAFLHELKTGRTIPLNEIISDANYPVLNQLVELYEIEREVKVMLKVFPHKAEYYENVQKRVKLEIQQLLKLSLKHARERRKLAAEGAGALADLSHSIAPDRVNDFRTAEREWSAPIADVNELFDMDLSEVDHIRPDVVEDLSRRVNALLRTEKP